MNPFEESDDDSEGSLNPFGRESGTSDEREELTKLSVADDGNADEQQGNTVVAVEEGEGEGEGGCSSNKNNGGAKLRSEVNAPEESEESEDGVVSCGMASQEAAGQYETGENTEAAPEMKEVQEQEPLGEGGGLATDSPEPEPEPEPLGEGGGLATDSPESEPEPEPEKEKEMEAAVVPVLAVKTSAMTMADSSNPFGDSDEDDDEGMGSPSPSPGVSSGEQDDRTSVVSKLTEDSDTVATGTTGVAGVSAKSNRTSSRMNSNALSAMTEEDETRVLNGVEPAALRRLIEEGFDKISAAEALKVHDGDFDSTRTALTKEVQSTSLGNTGRDLKYLWQSPIGVRVSSWLPCVAGPDGKTHTDYLCQVTVFATGAAWTVSLRWKILVKLDSDLRKVTEDRFTWMPKFPNDRMSTIFGINDAQRNERMENLGVYLRDLCASADLMLNKKARGLFDTTFKVAEHRETKKPTLRRRATTTGSSTSGSSYNAPNPISNTKMVMNRRRSINASANVSLASQTAQPSQDSHR